MLVIFIISMVWFNSLKYDTLELLAQSSCISVTEKVILKYIQALQNADVYAPTGI